MRSKLEDLNAQVAAGDGAPDTPIYRQRGACHPLTAAHYWSLPTTVNRSPDLARLAALGLTAFLWNMLFVWQGLDFTDMGYWLTGYQQLYSGPDGIGDGVINWLTYFVGHWLGGALGGTVLSYRIAAALVVSTGAMVAYLGLAAIYGYTRSLSLFVLLAVLFIAKSGAGWIDCNNLTALLYLTGAVLLFLGLTRRQSAWVVLSGVVLAANLFVRFPNILGLCLIAAIWFYAWLRSWSWRQSVLWSGSFIAGWVLGLATLWAAIVLHGHRIYYARGIEAVLGLAADPSSHHSGSLLIRLFLQDHLRALLLAVPLALTGTLLAAWIARKNRLAGAVGAGCGAMALAVVFSYQDIWKWIVTGLLYIGLAWIVWREHRRDRDLALMAFISAATLLLAPMGSGNGMRNALYGMWLALPLMLNWLWTTRSLGLPRLADACGAGPLLALTLASAIGLYSLTSSWQLTYRDTPSRPAMSHSVSHPLLRGVLTTESRSTSVDELLGALQTFADPGDTLLAYNNLPTLHFLTQTRPWLDHPWPDLYNQAKLTTLLDEKRHGRARLPVIVRATGSTRVRTWPVAAALSDGPEREAIRSIFDRFVETNGYRLVWSNGFFEILTPQPGKRKS